MSVNLSSKQLDTLKAKLEKHVTNCRVCDSNDFDLFRAACYAPLVEVEAKSVKGYDASSGLPLVALVCNTCGAIMFFSAAVMGLVEGQVMPDPS